MRRVCFALVVLSLRLAPAPAQGASDPEIYLLPLSVTSARIVVGKPVNVTKRGGYDNQPSFSPDGRDLLYTSTREDAQADIYRYNIASKSTERLTKTAPESEYSATFLPNRKRFSVIRVEKDSSQRLWSFLADGSGPEVVLTDIKPVGYHAWVDANHLALFVLGSPSSLVLADRRSGKGEVLARDIGRSLLPLPGDNGFSFLSHHGREWVLTEVRLSKSNDSVKYTRPIVTLPAGMDYVAWVGNDLIGGTGTKLYTWKRGGEWTELVDLAGEGLTRISRIAVSPDRKTIALVAEPAAPLKP